MSTDPVNKPNSSGLRGTGWRGLPEDDAPGDGDVAGEPVPAEPGGEGRAAQPTPTDDGTVVGEVRALAQRTELGEGVWTFRVERHDDSGTRLPPVPVELRSRRFRGTVHDGDWVRVEGRWADGVFEASAVRNLTTKGSLSTGPRRAERIVGIVVVAAILIAFAVAFVGFLATRSEVEGGRERIEQRQEEIDRRVDDIRDDFGDPGGGG